MRGPPPSPPAGLLPEPPGPGIRWQPGYVLDRGWAKPSKAPSWSACSPGGKCPPPTSECHARGFLCTRRVCATFSTVTGRARLAPGPRAGWCVCFVLLSRGSRTPPQGMSFQSRPTRAAARGLGERPHPGLRRGPPGGAAESAPGCPAREASKLEIPPPAPPFPSKPLRQA